MLRPAHTHIISLPALWVFSVTHRLSGVHNRRAFCILNSVWQGWRQWTSGEVGANRGLGRGVA